MKAIITHTNGYNQKSESKTTLKEDVSSADEAKQIFQNKENTRVNGYKIKKIELTD